MGGRGPGRPVGGYLKSKATPSGLDEMDAVYCERLPGGKPAMFHRVGEEVWQAYWGQPDPAGDRLAELGVRGRIWALCLLLVLYGSAPAKASTIALRIVNYARNRKDPVILSSLNRLLQPEPEFGARVRDPDHRLIAGYLTDLISGAQKDKFPPAEIAEDMLDLVVDYCQWVFFHSVTDTEEQAALEQALADGATAPAEKPSDIYRSLAPIVAAIAERKGEAADAARRSRGNAGDDDEAAVQREGDRRAAVSCVDPALAREVVSSSPPKAYVAPEPEDQADQDIDALWDAVRGRRRLIIVSGEPLLGKKTKVKGLLRLIASRRDKLILPLRSREDRLRECLPVLALSASNIHYRELVDKVLKFLEAYEAVATRSNEAAAEIPAEAGGRQFDEMFENIFLRFKGLPALFVFTDVEAFELDRTRHAIRDSGIRRLIEALLSADRDTRIVITTTQELTNEQANAYLARPRKIKAISVQPPRVADLKYYVREASYSRIEPAEILRARDTIIRGDDLIGLAALLGLAFDPRRGKGLSPGEAKTVIAFLEKDRAARNPERLALYEILVEAIRNWELLHPLALVAASHDGVRDDSLEYLLSLWRPHDPRLGTASAEATFAAISAFAEIAGHRFLRRAKLRYDPEEYAYGDRASAEDLVWDMDPLVAATFLEALAKSEPTIVAHSHRLIAAIARRRGQNKKVRMRSPWGSRAAEDASRDIQSYASLLASIQFDPARISEVQGAPLGLSEADIYSLDPQRFDPARALRFAAYSLLKEDIDHDFRLTMVFDEDALRLDLYLLLFQELGRAHPTKLKRRTLPERLPAHLRARIFSPDEILDLMSTVALSGFHAQRFEIVERVARLASAFVEENGIEDQAAKLSRLWCTLIDSYILRGRMPGGSRGHLDTLAFVQGLRQAHFSTELLNSVEPDPDGKGNALIKANMRLLAREADLSGIVFEDRSIAEALYAELEGLEAMLSTCRDQHDPVTLRGSVARRYIRFLLRDPALAGPGNRSSSSRSEILARIRALLDVNISRLRRYSGAERLGVMLDLARFSAAWGALDAARDYAAAANRRAFSGSASHAAKLDVLAVQAEVNLRFVEKELDEGLTSPGKAGEALEIAGIAAHDLAIMAASLEAAPTVALANYLAAWSLLSEFRLLECGQGYRGLRHKDPLEEARAALQRARQIMKDAADRSLDEEMAATQASLDQLAARK